MAMPTTSKSTAFSGRTLFSVFVLLAVILSLGLVDTDAQSRRKRRSRRARPAAPRPVITNPTILPPTTTAAADQAGGDVKIISTAESTGDGSQDPENVQPKKPNTSKSASNQDDIQQTITNLSNQVNRLNDRLSQMQDDDRYLLDMERLTRAEQRAEQLRSQLIDVQSKLADLGARLDQVEYMLRPENIDKATQGYGTVHPEEARESRKRQLENEKSRLQAQINILESSKTRLETAIATADSEVDLLRARLNQQRMDAASKPAEPKPTNPRKPE